MTYSYPTPLNYGPNQQPLHYEDMQYKKPSSFPAFATGTVLGAGVGAYMGYRKNPYFSKVGGSQVSLIVNSVKVEHNAFGDDIVTESKYTSKDFVVDYADPESPAWDTEESILATEVAKMLSDRQVKLATLKQRKEERKTAPAAAPIAQAGAFTGF